MLFHAALQLSAMRLQKARAYNSNVDIRQLSVECIRLLRDRVESSNNTTGVSDETISAVATLAAIEVRNSFSSPLLSFQDSKMYSTREVT